MKLQSCYLSPLLVFLVAAAAATNGGFAAAQEAETETLYTPTTTATSNPSGRPAQAYDLPELHPTQQQQQQQQQQVPGAVHHSFVRQQPSPIPADKRPVEGDVDVGPSDTGVDTVSDTQTNSQQDKGDNDVGMPESNVNVGEPLPLHHVKVEPEQEVEEASEHGDTDAFSRRQQQQQQQDPATAELDVEQLKRLLPQRQHRAPALDDSDANTEENDIEDDRTLLDIFGEVTKEYLTQNVVRYIALIDYMWESHLDSQ
jgi:hypothetical protein